MSTGSPPSEYFPKINFNYSFWSSGKDFVTKEYVDNNFLKAVGYAYSRAVSTSFSGIIYALGGIETTTIKASGDISANTFTGSGASLTSLNASNISTGTLSVARGGTGSSTFPLNEILLGNNTGSIYSTSLLKWDDTTDTLNSKFVGSGNGLTSLNADNFGSGILDITFGGTGVSSLIADRLLIGGTSAITQSGNLTFNSTTNIFTALNIAGNGSRLTNLNASNVSDGTLLVARGGTGATTFTAGRLLIGNGASAITEDPELTWNGTTNILTVTGTAAITTVNATTGNITTLSTTNIGIGITNPTTSSIEIVRPVTTATDIINMRYDATNGLRFQQAYVAANDVKINIIQKANNVDINALTFYKGNVGIGNTAPAATDKLSVTGNTKTTGTATIDTNLVVGGSAGIVGTSQFTGNMGIGKASSATLKLDVLGDAAISGTTTLGTLTNTTANITTANITTANITTDNVTSLNATRMNGRTQNLIGDADYIGAALFFISSTGTDSSATKTVNTVNGVYQLSVSSLVASGSKIENIFDNNTSTFWAALNNTYTKENALTTGRYLANTTGTINVNYFATTVTTIGVINGEWVQIKYPKRVAINNILFTPSTLPTAIIRGYLLGSNDGTTWDAVYTEFTVTAWTTTAERQLLPAGFTPNTKQYLFYRLVARQIQGVTAGALGATEKLNIATLRFTYNQNVAFIDSVLCIGDPVGGTTPAPNCILDINGATNMQGSVNILGNLGVGVSDTTTYKVNIGGTTNISGLLTANGRINFNTEYYGGGADFACNKINLWGSGGNYGFGISGSTLDYFTATNHRFLYGSGGTGLGTVGMQLSNNSLTVNGNIITPSSFYYSGSPGSTALNLAANDGYAELRVLRNSTSGYDHDMYINYAAGGGSRTRIYSNNSQTILCENNNVYMNSGGYTYTGQINSVFYSRSMTNTDYLCIGSNTALGSYTSSWIDVAYGSFTAFHRCYTDDVLYTGENDETIDLFKNNYMGRVVIATGKIKTDSTRAKEPEPDKPKNEPITQEWYSTIDKDGITIEDAIPIVQLSRTKKDKRVFGVLGAPTRSTNNKNRLIVNSIGEGAICVSNTNGNIENGDFIQSSDLLGYGEKQDDDLLHNYTIAKSTIDSNFELDSQYYQCHEIENGVRVAFIACTYHCG